MGCNMDKEITLKMPAWLAIKALQALQHSDPFGIYLDKATLERMALDIKSQMDKKEETHE